MPANGWSASSISICVITPISASTLWLPFLKTPIFAVITNRVQYRFRRITSFIESADSVATNLWFEDSQVLVGKMAPRFPRLEQEGIVNKNLEDGSSWRIIYR